MLAVVSVASKPSFRRESKAQRGQTLRDPRGAHLGSLGAAFSFGACRAFRKRARASSKTSSVFALARAGPGRPMYGSIRGYAAHAGAAAAALGASRAATFGGVFV